MKIAVFHELPRGGARRAVNSYAVELKKKHTVDLYFVDEKDSKSEHQFYSSVFFYKFMPRRWEGGNWRVRVYKDSVELINVYKLNKKIAADIDAKKYDVVFVSASKFIEAPFIMRFLKTPFLFFSEDPYYRIIYDPLLRISKDLDIFRYNYERCNRIVRKILDRKNVECAKICLAPSKYIAELFSKTYNKHVDVVYHGVDTNFFTRSKIKKNIDLFYIGSYEPFDGYKLLNDSLSHLKKSITVRKILIEEEWISDDKVLRDLYRRSKIMFCPAQREGLGLVLLEALSCGTTVIALDEAGHKEIIKQGKNGYLVPPNPTKIAKLLESLLSNAKEIRKLSEYGRDDIEKNWTWKKRTEELEKFLLMQAGYTHVKR